MDLAEFHLGMMEKLREFKNYYKDGIKSDPEMFPAQMNEVDWMEQFQAYMEIDNG